MIVDFVDDVSVTHHIVFVIDVAVVVHDHAPNLMMTTAGEGKQ